MQRNSCNNKFNGKKIAGSGLRVLELLKFLTLGPVDIIEFLKHVENNGNSIYRKEVILKYINTLKLLGFDIAKIKNKYCLMNSIETMYYTKDELSLLRFIENYTDETKQKDLATYIEDTIQKIERTFSQRTRDLINRRTVKTYRLHAGLNPKDKKIQIFEKFCQDKLKLKIKYKSSPCAEEEFFKVSPIKILYKKKQTVLIAYDILNTEYREFLLDFITYFEQTPQKVSNGYSKSVIFKLKGRLAKSYVLKQDEKVLDYGENFKIISNAKEDKHLILNRLLRYYDNCEIIYPVEARKQMTKLIEDIEKIYD